MDVINCFSPKNSITKYIVCRHMKMLFLENIQKDDLFVSSMIN